jgi:NADH dehydrogenase [ubiquinone] 1 alpha subcomplex assembly factor 5
MSSRVLLRSFRPHCRAFASATSSPINPNSVGPFEVFDRNVKRIQKNRAAARDGGQTSRTVDYVREEVADRMSERFMVCFIFYMNIMFRVIMKLGH